ncbi:hypothetical protein BVI1335_1520005 [Burkholderia vietnamiensis]|nr:hypothetical protein BVI1335_1520005 [Burkholderia vietnamiensis]
MPCASTYQSRALARRYRADQQGRVSLTDIRIYDSEAVGAPPSRHRLREAHLTRSSSSSHRAQIIVCMSTLASCSSR